MLKKLILLLLVSIVGATGIGMATAGAGPCAISGSDQGWYWHNNKVMQCVVDDNHMIIRQWGSGGVDEGVVFNAWYPASTYYWVTVRAPYTPTGSPLAFCPTTWNGVSDILTTTNHLTPPGWEQHFYWQPQNFDAGAINHFKGWPGSQAYGAYAHFTSGNCPYGGSATTFTWG